jgi:diacylglycerol kinase (ATP)
MSNYNQTGGLRRIWNAGLYSLAGIRAAWKNEAAFRQEVVLCLLLVPGAFWYGSDAIQRILLIGSCLLVLIVELLNSAVESTIDRIGAERHILSGRAKDMGSAAVLISLLLVVMTWGLIGYERFLS